MEKLTNLGLSENNCSCSSCKSMCLMSPCFPTPSDVDDLIEADLLDQLDYTVFVDVNTGSMNEAITPKSVDSLPGLPAIARRCVFLDDNFMCKLHASGLKPTEGKMMSHGLTQEQSVQARLVICDTWRTKHGQDLLNKHFKEDQVKHHQMTQELINEIDFIKDLIY